MDMSEVLKGRRAELGMSQAGLAETAGVNVRQIARYESGEQQPVLSVAVQLAEALSISLAELAGQIVSGRDLGGEWYAGWQTFKDGVQRLAIQEVTAHQHGQHVQVSAERTVPVEEGGYNWAGEFRVWDNEVLMGWYRGADGSVRSLEDVNGDGYINPGFAATGLVTSASGFDSLAEAQSAQVGYQDSECEVNPWELFPGTFLNDGVAGKGFE